jgi:hypothetical protein
VSAAFPHDCFDSSAAELPTRVVPIGDVIDLLPIPHAPEVVERYREDMLAQRRFPPVSVLPVGRWLLLADGHKRLTAYRSLSPSTILVEVWTLRRWLADQWRQARDNARKNAEILRGSVRSPASAARLAGTTLEHWWRVARCLAGRARSRG